MKTNEGRVKLAKAKATKNDAGVKSAKAKATGNETGVKLTKTKATKNEARVKLTKVKATKNETGVKLAKAEQTTNEAGVKLANATKNEAGVKLAKAKATKNEDGVKLSKSEETTNEARVKLAKAKAIAAKKQHTLRNKKGVLYLGHLPRGFYEGQMRAFFSQAGEVKNLRLSRSKRTGRSKGYGFVQFESDATAKVVADTMSNYLMYRKKMICEPVPVEKVHDQIFKGANRLFQRPTAHLKARDRHNKLVTPAKEKATVKKLRNKMKKRLEKLAELGINYTLPSQTITAEVTSMESTSQ